MPLRFKQLLKYGQTAGVAAVVDVSGYALLRAAGGQIEASAVISFLSATVVNYLLSAHYVFEAKTSFRGYGRFLTGALVGFLVNVMTTSLLDRTIEVSATYAKLGGVGLAFFVNFVINAIFVFPNDRSS